MPHLADLYRSASLLLQNASDAEDLVQEVYLEAWKSFHRFEPGTNCRAWLFKILFRRLHHLRRRLFKVFQVRTIREPGRPGRPHGRTAGPAGNPGDHILVALAKVPSDFREVVLMADVQDLSYNEIAETLKIPLGTVMSSLSRGRKLLRQELAEVARLYAIGPGIEREQKGESA